MPPDFFLLMTCWSPIFWGKLAVPRILDKKTQTSGFRDHLEPSFKDNVAHCAWIVLLGKIKYISVVTYYRNNMELLDSIYCCNI